MAGVPFYRYLGITTLANAGTSAVYCAAGAKGFGTGSFLLAVGVSIALPGAAMLVAWMMKRRRHRFEDKALKPEPETLP